MKKARVYLFFLVLFSVISGGKVIGNENAGVEQRQRRIYGTVTDQNGETLPYVTIIIRGTNIGTTSNENGIYEMNITDDVTLIFSYMGFRDLEVSTEGKTR